MQLSLTVILASGPGGQPHPLSQVAFRGTVRLPSLARPAAAARAATGPSGGQVPTSSGKPELEAEMVVHTHTDWHPGPASRAASAVIVTLTGTVLGSGQ